MNLYKLTPQLRENCIIQAIYFHRILKAPANAGLMARKSESPNKEFEDTELDNSVFCVHLPSRTSDREKKVDTQPVLLKGHLRNEKT